MGFVAELPTETDLPSGIILWVAEPFEKGGKYWAPCNITYDELRRHRAKSTQDCRRYGIERPNDQAVFAVEPLIPWLRRVKTGYTATRFDLIWPDTGNVLHFGDLEHKDEITHDFAEMMFSALRLALALRRVK